MGNANIVEALWSLVSRLGKPLLGLRGGVFGSSARAPGIGAERKTRGVGFGVFKGVGLWPLPVQGMIQ